MVRRTGARGEEAVMIVVESWMEEGKARMPN